MARAKPKVSRTPKAALADLQLGGDRLLGTASAAVRLGVSQKTLRQWRCEKRGPPGLKIGGSKQSRVAYRLSALESWIAKNATECGGAA